jgi:hypothetical protein
MTQIAPPNPHRCPECGEVGVHEGGCSHFGDEGRTVVRFSGDFGRAEYSRDERYRYRLSRLWDRTKDCILWIMLNPSTATECVFDPTVRRCYEWSKAWGYGSMEVCNLFALRSTDPKLLLTAVPEPVGPLNDEKIEEVVRRAALVMVAWGTHPSVKKMDRAKKVLRILIENGKAPFTLRVTKSGAPAHPLYLPKKLKPEPFISREVVELIAELSNRITSAVCSKDLFVIPADQWPVTVPRECDGSGYIKIYIGDGAGRTSGLPAESAVPCPGCYNCKKDT